MAERVVLHVGAMKTGTSFIQKRLLQSRDVLREQGILFPGTSWNDQVLAVSEVIERARQGLGNRTGKWAWLVGEIEAWPGTALVSMEFLAQAPPDKIQRVVESFAGTDLQVVLTVRDMNRSIPAMWQETLKNSRSWPWQAYLRGVRREKGAGKQFWREQDVVGITKRWVDAVGRDHFTLVTVPPPGAGPELLWERFCSVAGIAPGSCAPVSTANESLGAASALVLERVNRLLAERDVDWQGYMRHVKHGLAKKVLAAHREQEPALGLEVPPWVHRKSRSIVRTLERMGVRVVGDLAELAPVDVPGVDPRTVSERDQLDAAVSALAGVLERQIELDARGSQR